jgi:hypothetical protein
MHIPALLIGIAYDGPIGEYIKPTTMVDAMNKFGWQLTEVHTVTTTGTSITLDYPVFNNTFSIHKVVDTQLYDSDLFNVACSGNVITFTSRCLSGTYQVTYVPVQPENSLLVDLRAYWNVSNNMPYVLRVGGTKASLQFDSIVFSAINAGARYNNITISFDGTTLTITNPYSARAPSKSYTVTTIDDLIQSINRDAYYGRIPVELAAPSISYNPIPVGTWQLSGGTDGSITADVILEALNASDLNSIDCIVFCGGIAADILEEAATFVQENSSCCCIIAGSPLQYLEDPAYYDYLNNLPISSARVFYVGGFCDVVVGLDSNQYTWTTLAPVFAGCYALHGPIVHNKLPVFSVYPLWTTEQLHALSTRFVLATRFIQTGFGFYRAITTDGRSHFVLQACQAILANLSEALNGFIGEANITKEKVDALLTEKLSNIPNVRSLSFTSSVDKTSIEITITIVVVGEVQAITLSLVTYR